MVIYTKITVDGVQLNADSMKVDLSTGENNSSSTFTADLNNRCGYTLDSFSIGDEVVIYAHDDVNPPTQVIFKGILEKIDMSGQETEDRLTLSGRDYSARLMDALISPEVYNNLEVSVIVKAVMARYVTGITTTNVATTATSVTHMSLVNISVFDALKQLGGLCNHYFYIDTNKDLHFQPNSVVSSGVTLNNTNILYSDFAQTTREIYNSVYVYGSTVLTKWFNQFTGDGAGSVFLLDYRPHNTAVEVNGVLQKGDIYEFNVEAEPKVNYLVDFDQKKIIFVSGTGNYSIPGVGSLIDITYDRSSPLMKYDEDAASIAAYGKKTKIITDTNITEATEAQSLATYTVDEYASPRLEGNISIKGVFSLIPGNTVNVVLANENINQAFEIVSVTYDLNPRTILAEEVFTIRVSQKVLDLSDTLKQMMMDIKRLQMKDLSEVSTRLEIDTANFDLKDSIWYVKTRTIGNSFILGHPVNGMMNSIYELGSAGAGAWTIVKSGGD
jgi:hypothetical protein